MGNKKKRLEKTGVTEEHTSCIPSVSNDAGTTVQVNNRQSAESCEIKQEDGIKQEPVGVDELVEIPASTYKAADQIRGYNGHAACSDFDDWTLDEVKSEMKNECTDYDKKKEDAKGNADSDEAAVDDEQGQQPVLQGEDDLQQPGGHKNQKQGGDANKKPLKKHNCDICEYSASFKSHLDRHLLKHSGEKPHVCGFCPKQFTRKQNLHGHMKAHVKEFLFHCAGCLQGFNRNDDKLAHENDCKFRRYECHLCKESFGSLKGNVIRHMRMHTGDKPFECQECFKKFISKGNLNEHKNLHAGQRIFRCTKCHKTFLQQEEKDDHEGKCNRRAHECNICGKTCWIKGNLILHLRTHTGEKPFQCNVCSKKFSQRGDLKKHEKTHTKKLAFVCLICRQGFANDIKRKAHQRNCNERNYECHLCKKHFQSYLIHLKNHMRTHSGEKPFQCERCLKAFALKFTLNRHIKSIHYKNYWKE